MSPTDSIRAPVADQLKRLMLLRSVLVVARWPRPWAWRRWLSTWTCHGASMIGRPAAASRCELAGACSTSADRSDPTRPSCSCSCSSTLAVLSALLYLSGGSTNPFVSLYLLPLVIAATTLPPALRVDHGGRHGDPVTGCCSFSICRSAAHAPRTWQAGFQLHLVGMWVNFVLSAGIIAFFVARMAQAIRMRDAELARQKEDALRNERIVALGTLAAGAAHELGTPLSTMAVVLGEMTQDYADEPELDSGHRHAAQSGRCLQAHHHAHGGRSRPGARGRRRRAAGGRVPARDAGALASDPALGKPDRAPEPARRRRRASSPNRRCGKRS